jgi:hypothetical protein
MPASKIVEFEFDPSDNIWALFGDNLQNVTHVAFLDRATNDWSLIYDEINSPIDYSERMTLEIDTSGNPYVMQSDRFHVLDINNLPQWLGIQEQESITFSVYPNPSNGSVSVSLPEGVIADKFEIFDLTGRLIESDDLKDNIVLNVPSGTYFIQLFDGELKIGLERIVIN